MSGHAAAKGNFLSQALKVILSILQLVLMGVSTREKFIASLGNGAPEEEVLNEMAFHLDLITKNLAVLKEFYKKMEEERSDKF